MEKETYLSLKIYQEITRVRVENPQIILETAQKRKKRKKLTLDGKLTILAADHPARRVTQAGDNPIKMGNRYDFLSRIYRVLQLPEWDGIMGTTDILEELLILDWLLKREGKKSFLDGRVMIGCMNRGGLNGTIFEMDDQFTSFTAESIKKLGLDGAKLMFRLYPQSEASGKTINYCAKAITELNKYEIPVFLEALAVDENYKAIKRVEDLVKVVGVSTALGDSSRNIWLKIPYCEDFAKVASATTCPVLMLGGGVKEDIRPLFKEFYNGIKAGANVRGVLVGRNVLFAPGHDPIKVAAAVNGIIRQDFSVEKAMEIVA
jgi:DhnA family fructose-bisphosphate aldolase class Ia